MTLNLQMNGAEMLISACTLLCKKRKKYNKKIKSGGIEKHEPEMVIRVKYKNGCVVGVAVGLSVFAPWIN